MFLSPSQIVFAFGLLATAGGAQRPIFTVGGASPNFADLPAAIAGVPAGSVLVVRPGNYAGFTTSKPLRIVLAWSGPGSSIQPAAGSAYAITVSGLPSGDEFALVGSGSTIAAGSLGGIRVINTNAPVLLAGLNVVATGGRTGLDIQYVGSLHARNCVFAGGTGLQADWANLTLSECIVIGTGAGAVVNRSVFDVGRTFVSGNAQPALRCFDSSIRIASDGTTTIAVTGAPTIPISAIEGWLCPMQFDPTRIGLMPANGAPGVAQFGGYLLTDDVPTLTASPAPLGAIATARLHSNTVRPGMVVLGNLLGAPIPFQLANIFVDTVNAPIVAAIGLCGPTGLVAQTVIPPTTSVLGVVQCLQGVVWQPNGVPVLSAPALWITL